MREISICRDGGIISGYVVDAKQENLGNYLEEHTSLSGKIVNSLRKTNETVALLKNLMVEPEFRGQGIGSDLLGEFLSEAEFMGATCFALIADSYEEQQNGLDLTEWYEQFGFEKVVDTSSGPFMVMGDHVIKELGRTFKAVNDSTPNP